MDWEPTTFLGHNVLGARRVRAATAFNVAWVEEECRSDRDQYLSHRLVRHVKIQNYESMQQQPVAMEGSTGCQVRWLIGQQDRAPNFAMRQFEVAVGGHTPKHFHPYEHEVFVLKGQGQILEGDQVHTIKAGDCIYVAPDEVHQFRNTGGQPLEFLCLIPNSAMDKQVTVVPECGIESMAPRP